MSETSEARPAFYALRTGSWRDVVTLLHPPYTLMHLSFVVLGAALAPVVRWDRLAATLAAFFLAVGIAAHFLDELRGRPLRTGLSREVLLVGAGLSLLAACLVGVVGLFVVSSWLLLFVAVGAFIVIAYNLEFAGGAFHGDRVFPLFWGAFPFLTAYWVMDESWGWPTLPGAVACYAVARLQRALSTPARALRRRVASVAGNIVLLDGQVQPVSRETLLAVPERGLRCLCVAVPLLALAALLARG
jgi:hypothetical protein